MSQLDEINNLIFAVTTSNVYDETKMKYLLESAKNNNFNIEIIGVNKPFTFISRLQWIKEYLESLPQEANPIICFTDAYDVFYTDSLETIKKKFLSHKTKILWSAEKWYSFQIESDKNFYDDLCNQLYGYKYLNFGTFMGYKSDLFDLFHDLLEVSLKDILFIDELEHSIKKYDNIISGTEQTWMSHHLAKNWNKYDIKFDYECDIFYVPSEDWYNIDSYVNSDFVNIITGKQPSIVHVPWKHHFEDVLFNLFYKKYTPKSNNLLENKKYTWESNFVHFLENNEMGGTFGKGMYVEYDTHIFQVMIGKKMHTLVFNDDFTNFTSTRHFDNQIVKGNIIA